MLANRFTQALLAGVKSLMVMTVLGHDQPGLVDLLATTIADHHGNWLESRMAHLGGQFAGILRVEVPDDQERQLATALRSLQDHGVTVAFHSDPPTSPTESTSTAALHLVGHDRPGIVRSISGALARSGVNVEELETSCESAPMTGETLFHARARLQLPTECDVPALRQELERIAADLMVDLQFDL